MDENAEKKQEIFIDSNIFLYSYFTHKLANRCNRFLLEIKESKFKGFVNSVN